MTKKPIRILQRIAAPSIVALVTMSTGSLFAVAASAAPVGFVTATHFLQLTPGGTVDVGRIELELVPGDDQLGPTSYTGEARLGGVVDEEAHGGIQVEAVGTPFVAQTNREGRFRIEVLPGSPHTLAFSREGFAGELVEAPAVPEGESEALEAVVLAPNPGEARGRVLLAQHATPARIQAVDVQVLAAEGDEPLRTVNPGLFGGFTIDGLVPGAYRLRVDATGYDAAEAPLVIAPGRLTDVGQVALRHQSVTDSAQ